MPVRYGHILTVVLVLIGVGTPWIMYNNWQVRAEQDALDKQRQEDA